MAPVARQTRTGAPKMTQTRTGLQTQTHETDPLQSGYVIGAEIALGLVTIVVIAGLGRLFSSTEFFGRLAIIAAEAIGEAVDQIAREEIAWTE